MRHPIRAELLRQCPQDPVEVCQPNLRFAECAAIAPHIRIVVDWTLKPKSHLRSELDLIKRQEVTGVKLGRKTVVAIASIEAMLERNAISPKCPA